VWIWRKVRRRHIEGKGTSADATIIHVEIAEPPERFNGNVRIRMQLVIVPRGAPDFVAMAAGHYPENNLPQVGWTVPVSYIMRLGSTPLVQVTGVPVPQRASSQP
jgi:hypothetical protein